MRILFISIQFLIHVTSIAQVTDRIPIDSVRLLRNLAAFSADSMQGRGVGQTGGIKSQLFIANQFEALRLLRFDSSYFHKFHFASPYKKKKIQGVNLVGWIKGSDYPKKYIVISAKNTPGPSGTPCNHATPGT